MKTKQLLIALLGALLLMSCANKKKHEERQDETTEQVAELTLNTPDEQGMKLLYDTDKWQIRGFNKEGEDAYFIHVTSKSGNIEPYVVTTNYIFGLIGDYMVLGNGTFEPNLQIIELPTNKETLLYDESTADGIITPIEGDKGFYFNRRLPDNPHFAWNSATETWELIGTPPADCDPYALGLEYVSTELIPSEERDYTIISLLENARITFPDCQVASSGTYFLQPEEM
ncbi:MAG: hypothetical protein Q4D93_06405 [Porphyromonas sp.]|nr:hypothetical protein [Porphyromonas sp.]